MKESEFSSLAAKCLKFPDRLSFVLGEIKSVILGTK